METSDSDCFESADEDLYDDQTEERNEKLACIKDKINEVDLNKEVSNINKVKIHVDNATTLKDSSQKELLEQLHENTPCSQLFKTGINEIGSLKKDGVKVLKNIDFNDNTRKPTEEKIDNNEVKNEMKVDSELKKNERYNKYFLQDNCDIQKALKKTEEQIDNGKIEENLWEEDGDGWEIEDEIDIPTPKKDIMIEKDPISLSKENMWDNNEEWQALDTSQQKINEPHQYITEQNQNSNDSWSSWGTWGVTSLLSTATQSVSTITNQVSQGLTSVLETQMGIPSPEELARMNHKDENAKTFTEPSDHHEEINMQGKPMGYVFGNFGNLVSGVSTISTKVISGGLETLETIGKKTMEVLQEGDPGLKKKRAFLKLEQEKPVLSQVLREAKERTEQENKERLNTINQFVKKVNYESLFDDYHGLVHLEALEMLSKQCELKLKTLCDNCSGNSVVEIQETMDQIKELCELPDEDEEEQLSLLEVKEKLAMAVKEMNIKISYDRLIALWEEIEHWLDNIKTTICSENEFHQQAIETLAQMTALAVEQFHKAGELLLVKDHHSTADEADSLVQ